VTPYGRGCRAWWVPDGCLVWKVFGLDVPLHRRRRHGHGQIHPGSIRAGGIRVSPIGSGDSGRVATYGSNIDKMLSIVVSRPVPRPEASPWEVAVVIDDERRALSHRPNITAMKAQTLVRPGPKGASGREVSITDLRPDAQNAETSSQTGTIGCSSRSGLGGDVTYPGPGRAARPEDAAAPKGPSFRAQSRTEASCGFPEANESHDHHDCMITDGGSVAAVGLAGGAALATAAAAGPAAPPADLHHHQQGQDENAQGDVASR
jgi:hypothetical protein